MMCKWKFTSSSLTSLMLQSKSQYPYSAMIFCSSGRAGDLNRRVVCSKWVRPITFRTQNAYFNALRDYRCFDLLDGFSSEVWKIYFHSDAPIMVSYIRNDTITFPYINLKEYIRPSLPGMYWSLIDIARSLDITSYNIYICTQFIHCPSSFSGILICSSDIFDLSRYSRRETEGGFCDLLEHAWWPFYRVRGLLNCNSSWSRLVNGVGCGICKDQQRKFFVFVFCCSNIQI